MIFLYTRTPLLDKLYITHCSLLTKFFYSIKIDNPWVLDLPYDEPDSLGNVWDPSI